ncbi:MAG: L7Ae/L30e/S12e/Gadd45 family ribosomal protein [Christensenellales bacterium]|jgi:ribosomal protein L7Ae-like RNA K-turn-binding protein
MNDRFLTMLGMCAKAGKCAFGETACLSAIKSRKARLILVSSDASENSKKRFRDSCLSGDVPMLLTGEPIDAATGKPGRKFIAVLDVGFATTIAGAYAGEAQNTGGRSYE